VTPPPPPGRDAEAPAAPAAGGGQRRRRTTFPQTTMSMIGWAQSLTPVLKQVRPLERHARPCGDIRKSFGWPDDGE